jgi:hypothetical protein
MLCRGLKTLDKLDKVENKDRLEAEHREKEQAVHKSDALDPANLNTVNLAAVLGLPNFNLDAALL